MKRSLLVVLFLAFGFLNGFGQGIDELRREFFKVPSNTVMVAAHRAAHNKYPENSIQAIEEAIRIGVDIIEIDVKVSKDGIPFLMHDRTMDRTTNGQGDPEEFTWAELQQYRLVDKGKQSSQKIPSLEEALQLAKGKVLVDLDLKTDRIDAVMDVVKLTGTKDIVLFFDSDYNVLSRIYQSDKNYMIMPRAHSIHEMDSAIALFDPPVVHIDFSFYTPECVRLAQNSQVRVWINALGEVDEEIRQGKTKNALKKLLKHRADVIQTDEPELLLKALATNGYRNLQRNE